jgi:hypothetical protein
MTELLASMAVLGLVTGLSPFTMGCLFVVVDAPRPGRNGLAFLVGDAAALIVVMFVVGIVLGGKVDPDSDPRTGVLIAQVLLGVVLVVLSVRLLRAPKPSPDAELPAVFRKLQDLGPLAALVAGAATTMYPAAAVAATDIVTNELSRSDRLAAMLVFLVFAIGIPAIPVTYLAVSQSARDRLASWRQALLDNRTVVGGWLGTVVGLTIFLKAVASLL